MVWMLLTALVMLIFPFSLWLRVIREGFVGRLLQALVQSAVYTIHFSEDICLFDKDFANYAEPLQWQYSSWYGIKNVGDICDVELTFLIMYKNDGAKICYDILSSLRSSNIIPSVTLFWKSVKISQNMMVLDRHLRGYFLLNRNSRDR